MSLDPQAQRLLEKFADSGAMPPIEELKPIQLRTELAIRPPDVVDPVGSVENIFIDSPARSIPIRIYWPKNRAQMLLPLVIFFHGGGFVTGSLDSYEALCRTICHRTGMAIASVDYALAPEAKFPQAPEECYAATCWLAAQAKSMGVDENRIAVMGDSAGGCLATVVAQLATVRKGPAICQQLLVYPVTDYSFDTPSYKENADGYFLTKELMQWFWQHYLSTPEEGSDPMVSPLRIEDLSGMPPAVVITAGFDLLRDEGVAYAKRLQDAGVVVHAKHYPGMIHGFLAFPRIIDAADDAIAYLCDCLLNNN